jgi:hypothetical protein
MKIKKRKPSRFDARRRMKAAASSVPSEIASKMVCFKCGEKSAAMHECLTCEKLHEENPLKHDKFAVFACHEHNAAGLAAVKKHALVKHPANLLRVVAAGLKGEEI